VTLAVPSTVRWSHLHLSRLPSGEVAFDWAPIEALCAANGLDVEVFRAQHEDNVAGLLTAWYRAHRANGGDADPVMDALIVEAWADVN